MVRDSRERKYKESGCEAEGGDYILGASVSFGVFVEIGGFWS